MHKGLFGLRKNSKKLRDRREENGRNKSILEQTQLRITELFEELQVVLRLCLALKV